MIRVTLPYHLQNLARTGSEVQVPVIGPLTIASVIDGLEAKYPMLKGTVRDYGTNQRRPFLRFFVCGEDWSLESLEAPLPEKIAKGEEPFLIIGAIAGG
jgi:molybdopterin synthase sulfur carrier subunit